MALRTSLWAQTLALAVCIGSGTMQSARAEEDALKSQTGAGLSIGGQSRPPDTSAARGLDKTPSDSAMTMAVFLDRLMIAESSGRADARNPRSSATGAYQFIESTFLDIIRRHFPDKSQSLSIPEQLALRLDPEFSRKAAELYTRENAAALVADGHEPTYPNLRLAYLLGASGASRVLSLQPNAPVAAVLSGSVLSANPFLTRLTAGELVARAASDISLAAGTRAALDRKLLLSRGESSAPAIKVRCNLGLASCRRWLALKKRQLARKARSQVALQSKRAATSVD